MHSLSCYSAPILHYHTLSHLSPDFILPHLITYHILLPLTLNLSPIEVFTDIKYKVRSQSAKPFTLQFYEFLFFLNCIFIVTWEMKYTVFTTCLSFASDVENLAKRTTEA